MKRPFLVFFGMLSMKAVIRGSTWCVGALLLLGSAVASPVLAASPARYAAVVATASKTPGGAALSSLLPRGAADCGQQSAAQLVAGLTGLSVSYACNLPKLAKAAVAYAYAFDNAGDYTKSLAAFNTYKEIVPSWAGNHCPVKVPTDFGIIPWHSSNFPAIKGQGLECELYLTTGSGTKTTADYIWTLPSKNAILDVVVPGLPMPRLDAWWKANAVKQGNALLAPVSGRQHASTLVNAYPLDPTNCTPLSRSAVPPGLVGLVLTNYCSLPKLGPQSTFYAYGFDNTQDYLTSLEAYNAYKLIDPSKADNECPMASGFTNGVTQWHNSSFPSRSGQELECLLTAVAGGTVNNVPDYIWTLPSENVILEATGEPGMTMQAFDTWWTHNSDT
jgi:uncharacterized protein YktA (UPF0223 family)